MAIKVAIANQKGGVGKTTAALCISDALIHCGYNTLMVDLDPQCNTTSIYKAKIEGECTAYDLFVKECEPQEAIQKTDFGDIIAGDPAISGQEAVIKGQPGGYFIIKEALEAIEKDYDFIIMDTPPNLGSFMLNALTAADGCIIPIRAEKFAIDGLKLLIDTINEAKKYQNKDLKIYGVLMSMYDMRTSLGKNVWNALPEMGDKYGFPVFKTAIRTCQVIQDSQAEGQSLFEMDKRCNAAVDYANVVKELLEVSYGKSSNSR